MKRAIARKWLGWTFALTSTRVNVSTIGVALCSLLALLGSPAGVAAIDFAAAKSYPVGTSPAAIAVGDFNGDGKVDIAVANTRSGDVSILLGNGDGTFQPAVNFGAGNSPNAIAVGDFNGDGKLDLAVFQAGANGIAGSVSILLGNGDGTFQPSKVMTFSQTATFMAIADFNLDKKADLALCDSTGLNVFLGNGDGTFQTAKNTALSATCTDLATADFNGDAKPDVAYDSARGIQILMGKGDGTFTLGALIAIPQGSFVTVTVLAADINHDGKMDLFLNSIDHGTCNLLACTTSAIELFLGNGDGSFQSGQFIVTENVNNPRGPYVTGPLVGDFNGDGKLDLAYQSGLDASFLLGKGDGSFSLPCLDVLLPSIRETVAQDLNGDKLDDVIAIGDSNNIEVLLNNSPNSGTDLTILSPSVSAGPYAVGMNLTFTAETINQGPQDATGVTFTDTLPNGVNFVSATATPGSCVQLNGIVNCSIGALASAFNSIVTIVATPTAVGTITNTMNVSGNESDLVPGNNSATQTVTIVSLVTLTITDAGKGAGTVTANLGAINCGSSCSGNYAQGTSVSLTATPAAGSVFSSWSGACTGTDPNNCTIVMNSAQSATATFALAPDFTMVPASASFTMQTGAQVTDALALTGKNGFSGQVNLSCTVSGPAPLATCAVSPSSVSFGANSGTSTLTITAPTSRVAFAPPLTRGERLAAIAVVLPVPGLMLGAIGLTSRRSRKRGIILWFLGSGVIALLPVLAGCGGSTPPPPKNYAVTVTATSATGSIQHSAPVAVTVE